MCEILCVAEKIIKEEEDDVTMKKTPHTYKKISPTHRDKIKQEKKGKTREWGRDKQQNTVDYERQRERQQERDNTQKKKEGSIGKT